MNRLLLALLLVPLTLKADWPQWRGPGGQGHADGKLPLSWSETKNVDWKIPIPGRGWSSPVVLDGQVWLTTAFEAERDSEEETPNTGPDGKIIPTPIPKVDLHAVCVDMASGKVLHNVQVFSVKEPQMIHKQNSYASPSPVIEKGRVYVHFGAYGTACLDTGTGKVLWKNSELVVQHENGPGSCPTLSGNNLIFHMDGSDLQYIVALDKVTGKIAWKTDRTGELNDNYQLKKAYGTPLSVTLGGHEQLLSNAADWLYSYELGTGKELWKMPYGRLGFSNVARLVVGHGLIFMPTGFSKSQMFAVRADGKGEAEIEWTYKRNVPTGPSPILVGDELYFVSDQGGLVSCLDAKSGELVWKDRLAGGNYWASPIFGDGKLYFFSEQGVTSVLKPGKAFEKLAENQLDGLIMGSAAVAGNAFIIRTDEALYRIGER
ncbi:MAG: PQQ-binding-like beta-propeller repeat protein [Verrucomicrobiales bacterium]|jgi:outer membrane protein assembly factor BamB|nr:PQQ-binding-like beta-propeller repeat protein [Verrucomicrobiales bacterium]